MDTRELAPDETARTFSVTATVDIEFTVDCQPGDEDSTARDALAVFTVNSHDPFTDALLVRPRVVDVEEV